MDGNAPTCQCPHHSKLLSHDRGQPWPKALPAKYKDGASEYLQSALVAPESTASQPALDRSAKPNLAVAAKALAPFAIEPSQSQKQCRLNYI